MSDEFVALLRTGGIYCPDLQVGVIGTNIIRALAQHKYEAIYEKGIRLR